MHNGAVSVSSALQYLIIWPPKYDYPDSMFCSFLKMTIDRSMSAVPVPVLYIRNQYLDRLIWPPLLFGSTILNHLASEMRFAPIWCSVLLLKSQSLLAYVCGFPALFYIFQIELRRVHGSGCVLSNPVKDLHLKSAIPIRSSNSRSVFFSKYSRLIPHVCCGLVLFNTFRFLHQTTHGAEYFGRVYIRDFCPASKAIMYLYFLSFVSKYYWKTGHVCCGLDLFNISKIGTLLTSWLRVYLLNAIYTASF